MHYSKRSNDPLAIHNTILDKVKATLLMGTILASIVGVGLVQAAYIGLKRLTKSFR
jgi:hypothetical protein